MTTIQVGLQADRPQAITALAVVKVAATTVVAQVLVQVAT